MYPLANDENGHPIEVPLQVAGWLVRRHAGGKGRPGAVYDQEGRPLVVALDARIQDLRARGCCPGPYRLEAVDGNRRTVQCATAYTEIPESTGDESTAEASGARGADDRLARVIEAQQRTHAETLRELLELCCRAVDRLGPQQAQPTLRNALTEQMELRKLVRHIEGDANAKAKEASDDERDDAAGDGGGMIERLATHAVEKGVEQLGKVVNVWIWKQMGLTAEQMAALAGAAANSNSAVTAAASAAPVSEAARGRGASLAEIFSHFTDAEQDTLGGIVAKMPAAMQNAIATQIATVPVDAAIAWVRANVLGPLAAGAKAS